MKSFCLLIFLFSMLCSLSCGGGGNPVGNGNDAGFPNDSFSNEMGGVNASFRQYDGGEKDGQWFIQLENTRNSAYNHIEVTTKVRAYAEDGTIILEEISTTQVNQPAISTSTIIDVPANIAGIRIISCDVKIIEQIPGELMFGTWRFEFSEGDSAVTWPTGPFVIFISYNEGNITIDLPVELLNITGDPEGYKGAGITTITSNKYWYGGFIQNDTFSRTWVTNHYSYTLKYSKDFGYSEMMIKIPNGSLGNNNVGEGAYSGRYFGYIHDS